MRCSHLFQCGFGLGAAIADGLAGAFIDDDGDDVGELVALIGVEHGVGEGGQQQGKACDAHGPAATVEIDQRRCKGDGHSTGGPEQGPADEGQEGDVPAAHWSSLSSSAGTWTWSAL